MGEFAKSISDSMLARAVGPAILCLLTAPAASQTQAPSWTDLDAKRVGTLELDTNSVANVDGKVFRATWRSGTDLQREYSVNTGRIDCDDSSITLELSVWFSTIGGSRTPQQSSVYNYVTGTVAFASSSWKAKEMSWADKDWEMTRLSFPEIGSRDGRIVRAICQGVPDFRDKHEVVGDEIQKVVGCGSKAMTSSPLCRSDLATRELLGQMFQRILQVDNACSADPKDTSAMGDVWLDEAKTCPRAAPDCDLVVLRMQVDGLGKDLARAAAGKQCSSLPRYLKSARESVAKAAADAEITKSAKRFVGCADAKIPLLDDKASPADVVAKGVFGACSAELAPELRSNEKYAELMMPQLIGRVLEQRSKSRQTPAKR